jgi:hypothetical protein
MLITAYPGEPYNRIAASLNAMVKVKYPDGNYLCDEGNDPKLVELCKTPGVIHVTRSTHENTKAGNIKVPYILTPKEHSSKGDFILGIPNLLISALSIGAAANGLNSDWQTYSVMKKTKEVWMKFFQKQIQTDPMPLQRLALKNIGIKSLEIYGKIVY